MGRLVTALVLVVGLALPVVAAEGGDAIVGLWLTAPSDNGRARVEVREVEEGRYDGSIVWLEKPTYPEDDERGMGGQKRVDRENPDPELRQRPILGLKIVEGFEYAGDKQWKDGTIYDPENGKTYRAKAKLEGDTLKVRGFIGFSLLGRTTEWTRVEGESALEEGS